MIFRHTNCMRRMCIYIGFTFLIVSPFAFAKCDLRKTPLVNEEVCTEFIDSDRVLNTNYRALIAKLDNDAKETLRTVQREWIKWRDKKCRQVQEESGCNRNGSCNGVAHDMCIVDLTDQRADELREFIENVNVAKRENFAYSKAYD